MTWGAYVHVPWCRVQCPYCAFDVQAGARMTSVRPWTEAVLAEHALRRPDFHGPPSTLFFGGGTPSRLAPDRLAAVVKAIGPTGEVTAEANPEDVDEAWLEGVRRAGIDRLSLGVQSFHLSIRKRLGRAWVAADPLPVARAVARAGFRSWSVDLIFAVPGQTLEDLDADIDRILDLEVPHVAVYGLTFEPGTPFGTAHARGRLDGPGDETWRAMYDRLVDRLGADGLERYELSNFARAGHSSSHNRLYWTDQPYMGLGPSAHGYLPDGRRYANVAGLPAYLAVPDPTATLEQPSPRETAVDRLVSGLRAVDGVDLGALARRTGLGVPDLGPLMAGGLVHLDGSRLRLTHEGFPVCDAVVSWLADRLVSVDPPK